MAVFDKFLQESFHYPSPKKGQENNRLATLRHHSQCMHSPLWKTALTKTISIIVHENTQAETIMNSLEALMPCHSSSQDS